MSTQEEKTELTSNVRQGTENTQAEEMVMAFEEGRQPVCVHCGHKLDKVLESQYDDIMWRWIKNGRYYSQHDR